jgi:hypothetical protein
MYVTFEYSRSHRAESPLHIVAAREKEEASAMSPKRVCPVKCMTLTVANVWLCESGNVEEAIFHGNCESNVKIDTVRKTNAVQGQ